MIIPLYHIFRVFGNNYDFAPATYTLLQYAILGNYDFTPKYIKF
jgi:hypothetical protein